MKIAVIGSINMDLVTQSVRFPNVGETLLGTSFHQFMGGKGANLPEMAGHPDLLLPVPPGFTITTEVCTYYYDHGKSYPESLIAETNEAIKKVEHLIGRTYGDKDNPLLLSVSLCNTIYLIIRHSPHLFL